jgi:hypothetical protein
LSLTTLLLQVAVAAVVMSVVVVVRAVCVQP